MATLFVQKVATKVAVFLWFQQDFADILCAIYYFRFNCEFIRRYLQHVLPKGFHKVRYYGIWRASSHHHVSKLARQMAIVDASNQLPRETPRKTIIRLHFWGIS